MNRKPFSWRRWWARTLCGAGVALFFPLLAEAGVPMLPAAAERMPAPKGEVHQVQVLTLPQCVEIALSRQSAIAAARASLAAAQDQVQALDNLHLASVISHEISIRRKQADLGVVIASAGVSVEEAETIWAVTRQYYTYNYAMKQAKVVKEMIDRLEVYERKYKDQEEKQYESDLVMTYLYLARSRQIEAVKGAYRALAALREAMGVDGDFPCFIPAEDFPELRLTFDCDQVVNLALERRGELAQAVNLAEVVALEVDAQGATCKPVAKTFASGSDIHVRPVPQRSHGKEYSPGAVGVEMPPNLVGKRKDRMARARDLHGRAEAVVEKTRSLVILEAREGFLRWQQEAGRMAQTREATRRATPFVTAMERDFSEFQTRLFRESVAKLRSVLDALALKARAQAEHNEAVYQALVALADLERITAGAIQLSHTCPPH
jgi:outer membrane protein TolC